MVKIMSKEALNQGDIDFIKVASYEMIHKYSNFLETLRRADFNFEKSRWDGLQSHNPPLGYIFVEPLSAQAILGIILDNRNLLKEFNSKVEECCNLKDVSTDDCSRVDFPYVDITYGKCSLALNVFGYTLDREGSFEPVKNPLVLSENTGLERLANLEFAF